MRDKMQINFGKYAGKHIAHVVRKNDYEELYSIYRNCESTAITDYLKKRFPEFDEQLSYERHFEDVCSA